MAIIETCIKTIDFYDTSDTIKEQEVERYIFGTGCTSENILHSKHLMNGNCCITNNVTGEEIHFDSRDAFESWKAIVSLDELINCVIVIQSEGEYSKVTTRYHFEDVTLSASKRIKLYNFEVLDKDTGELVPNVSFKTVNCSRGLDKIAKAIKGKENNHIVRLNGFDITEYFTYGISYSVSIGSTAKSTINVPSVENAAFRAVTISSSVVTLSALAP